MKNILFKLKNYRKYKLIYIIPIIFIIIISGNYLYFNALILDENHKHTYSKDNLRALTLEQDITSEEDINKKGYHIHVNLDSKQLYVYKDGQFIKSYPCSGGKTLTPSPTGTWKIIDKGEWGDGFGGSWMGLNVPWGEYGIHGTVYPWVVGKYNVSAGCIRMYNEDAKELYSYIPFGTTVTIVHESRPFRTMISGDIGSDVREIQIDLKKLGYYNGSLDGVFGDVLKKAVEDFQTDNKIYCTGKVDRNTLEILKQKVLEHESTGQLS